MKTLKLYKRGMNFYNDETIDSDIGNFRIVTGDYNIKAKDGNNYFIEFSLWRNRKKARYNHKITGKPLKHIKYDIINKIGLSINMQYIDKDGFCWGAGELEQSINEKNYSYTKKDILQAINEISIDEYIDIEVES
jgi:hypothetical protein